jgi:tripartite-type tricarboxylate transporter receptor subunit TctC
MIIQGTHRLATPEEIAQWKAEQAIQKRLTEEEHARRQAKVQVTPKVELGDDFKQLVARLIAQQQPLSEQRESAAQPRHGKQQN